MQGPTAFQNKNIQNTHSMMIIELKSVSWGQNTITTVEKQRTGQPITLSICILVGPELCKETDQYFIPFLLWCYGWISEVQISFSIIPFLRVTFSSADESCLQNWTPNALTVFYTEPFIHVLSEHIKDFMKPGKHLLE